MKWGQRAAYWALLGAYLALCVWVILFHRTLSTLYVIGDLDFRSVSWALGINGAETLLNVLIFVPMGVYLELLSNRSARVKLLRVLEATMGLEALQYALCVGTSDLMDVLANLLGGALGIAACRLLKRALGKRLHGAMLPLLLLGTAAMWLAVLL